MIRLVTLAALAASIAIPASARDIRVSLVSKTPEQVHADIRAAARTVCRRATSSETFQRAAYDLCVKDTVADGFAKANAAMAPSRSAEVAQR